MRDHQSPSYSYLIFYHKMRIEHLACSTVWRLSHETRKEQQPELISPSKFVSGKESWFAAHLGAFPAIFSQWLSTIAAGEPLYQVLDTPTSCSHCYLSRLFALFTLSIRRLYIHILAAKTEFFPQDCSFALAPCVLKNARKKVSRIECEMRHFPG